MIHTTRANSRKAKSCLSFAGGSSSQLQSFAVCHSGAAAAWAVRSCRKLLLKQWPLISTEVGSPQSGKAMVQNSWPLSISILLLLRLLLVLKSSASNKSESCAAYQVIYQMSRPLAEQEAPTEGALNPGATCGKRRAASPFCQRLDFHKLTVLHPMHSAPWGQKFLETPHASVSIQLDTHGSVSMLLANLKGLLDAMDNGSNDCNDLMPMIVRL